MLAGISEVRRLTAYAIVGTIASAALMEVLVGPFGQVGVVIGLLGGFVPFYFVGGVYQSVRVLRKDVIDLKEVTNDELARVS